MRLYCILVSFVPPCIINKPHKRFHEGTAFRTSFDGDIVGGKPGGMSLSESDDELLGSSSIGGAAGVLEEFNLTGDEKVTFNLFHHNNHYIEVINKHVTNIRLFLQKSDKVKTGKKSSPTVCLVPEKKKFKSLMDILDKPNVHRMVEFFSHQLPKVGHPSFVGELRGERAHQRLKRVALAANNRNVHLYAMKQNCLSDWRARIALELAHSGNNNIPHYAELRGPDNCVLDLLKHHSPGIIGQSKLRNKFHWVLERTQMKPAFYVLSWGVFYCFSFFIHYIVLPINFISPSKLLKP